MFWGHRLAILCVRYYMRLRNVRIRYKTQAKYGNADSLRPVRGLDRKLVLGRCPRWPCLRGRAKDRDSPRNRLSSRGKWNDAGHGRIPVVRVSSRCTSATHGGVFPAQHQLQSGQSGIVWGYAGKARKHSDDCANRAPIANFDIHPHKIRSTIRSAGGALQVDMFQESIEAKTSEGREDN